MRRILVLSFAIVLGAFLSGCAATPEASNPVTDAAGKVGDAAGKVGNAAGDAAGKVGEAAMDFASDAGLNSTVVPQIKSALEAEPTLKAAGIDVNAKDKLIKITGKVPSNEVKKKADEIVKTWTEKVTLPGDVKIVNSLVVG